MSRRARSLLVTVCALLLAVCTGQSALADTGNAGLAISGVPNAVPSNDTPDFVDGAVEALTQVGDKVFIGGSFTQLKATQGGATENLPWLVAVDKNTGVLDRTFHAPTAITGEITALTPAADGSLFVAGKFPKKVLKLDPTTGAALPTFAPGGINGQVNDIVQAGTRLLLSGYFTKIGTTARGGLASLDATTGLLDSYLTTPLTMHHNNNTGKTPPAQSAVGGNKFGLSPDASQLIVTGNFKNATQGTTVYPRDQIVKIVLGATSATVDPNWRSLAFTAACNPSSYDFYMRGIEFAPSGSYYVITTTGGTNNAGENCDRALRFEASATGQAVAPTWTAVTGRDSLYSVAVTNDVVYVGGHPRWLNNDYGQDAANQGAVPRPGLAALDARTGVPVSWNPGRNPRGHGAEAMLATPEGLWVGSDTDNYGNRVYPIRGKVLFFPFAGGAALAPDNVGTLPGDVYLPGRRSGVADQALYRVNAGGPALASTDGGPSWSADTSAAPSANHNAGATTSSYSPTLSSYTTAVPSYAPRTLFNDTRYDPTTAPEMQWQFAVPAGHNIRVNLFFSNHCSCTSTAGKRKFTVAINGVNRLTNYDIVADAGNLKGQMKSLDVLNSPANVVIDFKHVVENPLVDGIEILDLSKPAQAVDSMTRRGFDGTTTSGTSQLPNQPVAWSRARGAFVVGGYLYYGGSSTALLYKRTISRNSDGSLAYGDQLTVDPYNDPAWSSVPTGQDPPVTNPPTPAPTYRGKVPTFYSQLPNVTGMTYSNGWLYYTLANDSRLLKRAFSPDSGVISPVERVVATSPVFADAAGLLLSGNTLYVGSRGNGSLRSTSFAGGVPGSSFTTVNGPGSGWDAWGMFLVP